MPRGLAPNPLGPRPRTGVHTRLAVMPGDKGCLSLFGQKPAEHRLFADHVTAEYRVRT